MNNKERLRIHKQLFQKIHFCQVSHNHERLVKILGLISDWSFATRAGNGEASDAEVTRMQDSIMKKLDEI